MEINNVNKLGYSRLKNIFRTGIGYANYNEIVTSTSRPVVGNLPQDLLQLVLKNNPNNKKQAILEVQNIYIKTCSLLSGRIKLIQEAINRMQINDENILNIMFALDHNKSLFADEIFTNANSELMIKAQSLITSLLRRIIPSVNNVKISFIAEGTYSTIFKQEIFDKDNNKLCSDKAIKCFHPFADIQFGIDKKCSDYLLNHTSQEILQNTKSKKVLPNEEEFEKIKQNILKSVQSMTTDGAFIQQYNSKIHGAYAESNIAEYIKYMSGHKLTYRDGILLPDMYVLSDKSFALSEFVTPEMKAERIFDFGRLGLFHSDLANNSNNLINGICIDIGGIMPAVDFSKLQEISKAKKADATLSLRNVFECIEKARKSIIIGDKPATRFLKRCKELSLQHFNTEKILNNTEYLGLFKRRKGDIVSEIINKMLLS